MSKNTIQQSVLAARVSSAQSGARKVWGGGVFQPTADSTTRSGTARSHTFALGLPLLSSWIAMFGTAPVALMSWNRTLMRSSV